MGPTCSNVAKSGPRNASNENLLSLRGAAHRASTAGHLANSDTTNTVCVFAFASIVVVVCPQCMLMLPLSLLWMACAIPPASIFWDFVLSPLRCTKRRAEVK